MLHLTAKSTQFGKKTLTSWLIEAAGTVPIQRRKDFADGDVNNDPAMTKLTQVLAPESLHGSFLIRRSPADIGDGRCRVPLPRRRK
jgi:hypothetical protein